MAEWKASIVQPGARMHFAVAKEFAQTNHLKLLSTDVCMSGWLMKRIAYWLPRLRRYQINISDSQLRCAPISALLVRIAQRFFPRTRLRVDAEFWYSDRLARLARRGFEFSPTRRIAFGFDVSSLEFFRYAKQKNALCVIEQCVAPRRTQQALLTAQKELFTTNEFDADMERLRLRRAREEEEWQLADMIVAPSSFVRDELLAAGVDQNKVRVIPYGFTPQLQSDGIVVTDHDYVFEFSHSRLRVLFVGSVDVRKGGHDLIRVATNLDGLDVVALGKVSLPSQYIRLSGNHVRLLGSVPFAKVWVAFQHADVFVLPSYLEGSATVIYEALAAGLPVITTRQAGSVVEDGVDGLLFEAGDRDALAAALTSLRDDPELRKRLSDSARAKAQEYTREKYVQRLISAIDDLVDSSFSDCV